MTSLANADTTQWLGRGAGVIALMFGGLVGASAMLSTFEPPARLLFAASSLLTLFGGFAYLTGLERIPEPRGRRMRMGGWAMFSLGLLLPTSLIFVQAFAIVAGIPAAFRKPSSD
jgi:hypothetical protein